MRITIIAALLALAASPAFAHHRTWRSKPAAHDATASQRADRSGRCGAWTQKRQEVIASVQTMATLSQEEPEKPRKGLQADKPHRGQGVGLGMRAHPGRGKGLNGGQPGRGRGVRSRTGG